MRSSKIGAPQHFRWLEGIAKAIIILNLADALFTLFWVRAGLAEEANVLLRQLVNQHAVMFVVVKVVLVSLGTLLLWWYRRRPLAVVGLVALFLVYYFVLLYHLRSSSLLV